MLIRIVIKNYKQYLEFKNIFFYTHQLNSTSIDELILKIVCSFFIHFIYNFNETIYF